MGGSSKPTGTQTTKTEPWAEQQPYLKAGFENIGNLLTTEGGAPGIGGNTLNLSSLAPEFYKGSTVVAPDVATQLAQQMQVNRGLQGNQAVNAAQNNLAATSRGDFLNSNPYLDQTFNQAAQQVKNMTSGQFSQAGRYGSGRHQAVAQEGYNQLANQIYGGNYQNERNRQMQAAGLAPQYGNQDFLNIQGISDVGAQRESTARDYLQEAMDRYYYNQNRPLTAIQTYMDLIQGNYGGTSQQPIYGGSGLGNALGMAASAASIYSALGGSDERLKEDIKLLGKENGHNIYEFRYKGAPERYIGVMAQEVQKTHPEAIGEFNGYLTVNYDAIGVKMRKVV